MSERDSTQDQISPTQLAEESTEEIHERGVISEEEVDDVYNTIAAKNTTPQSTPTKHSLRSKLETVLDAVTPHIPTPNKHNAYGTITNTRVESTDYENHRVHMTLTHPDGETSTIWLNTEETRFANLIEYHNCDTAKELEGKQITRDITGHGTYCIPHDTSLFGKVQYKLNHYLTLIQKVPSEKALKHTMLTSAVLGVINFFLMIGFTVLFGSNPEILEVTYILATVLCVSACIIVTQLKAKAHRFSGGMKPIGNRYL